MYLYDTRVCLFCHQVPLVSGEYIFVEDNDILGFANEYDSGSLSYSFVNLGTVQTVGPYSATLPSGGVPSVGDALKVSTVGMPYDFAVGTMYDTSKYFRSLSDGR